MANQSHSDRLRGVLFSIMSGAEDRTLIHALSAIDPGSRIHLDPCMRRTQASATGRLRSR